MSKLYQGMSQEEFDGGYFYATELKAFAKTLGITVGNLKKNELELHIKAHLFGYSGELPVAVPNRKNSAARDLLTLDTLVVNYVSDKRPNRFYWLRLSNSLAHWQINPVSGTGLITGASNVLAREKRLLMAIWLPIWPA
ncbi:hypothetical protein [Xenorhabdus szentirmaii]|uniref:hypothetical protein n=1 Tax=Xenorhabdus szentirmaii TaxID=290112 RepID=UPI002B413C6F|nr:hypothetical protein [Xenorhabdus sp. CUL]